MLAGIRLIFLTRRRMVIGLSNKPLKLSNVLFPVETIQVKNQMPLNKINLIVTAMALLMLGLIPIVYAHNQDWNDGFKSGIYNRGIEALSIRWAL